MTERCSHKGNQEMHTSPEPEIKRRKRSQDAIKMRRTRPRSGVYQLSKSARLLLINCRKKNYKKKPRNHGQNRRIADDAFQDTDAARALRPAKPPRGSETEPEAPPSSGPTRVFRPRNHGTSDVKARRSPFTDITSSLVYPVDLPSAQRHTTTYRMLTSEVAAPRGG